MATPEHCLFCFETLAAHLEKRPALDLKTVEQKYAAYQAAQGKTPNPALQKVEESATSSASASSSSLGNTSSTYSTAASSTSADKEGHPLFVTWNTTEGEPEGEHVLRGCIGTFEAQPLEKGLKSYALTAALNDERFRPIRQRELQYLQVGVTLLTDFEPANDAFDWTLGEHGLRISFAATPGGRRYSATYLPDVAPEQRWTKEQTIVSLMRKAGWSGGKEWRDVDLKVIRYQGKKAELLYDEYKKFRDWMDE